jgi:Kef-type K+ transport system membrane component KefB
MLKDLKDMETLSELGVLFLLYEQGLELSLDRLKVSAGAAAAAAGLNTDETEQLEVWCRCSRLLCM